MFKNPSSLIWKISVTIQVLLGLVFLYGMFIKNNIILCAFILGLMTLFFSILSYIISNDEIRMWKGTNVEDILNRRKKSSVILFFLSAVLLTACSFKLFYNHA